MANISTFGQLTKEAEAIKILAPELFEKIEFKAIIDSDNETIKTTEIINAQCTAIGRIGELSEQVSEAALFVHMNAHTVEINNEFYTDFVEVVKDIEKIIPKKTI